MRWLLVLMIIFALAVSSQAQEAPAAFRLLTETTELHTGEPYTISVRLDASDVWAFSLKIDYDPTILYIVGTQSGQPLTTLPLLNSAEGMTIFNHVQNNQLEYVYSRVSPASSANYSDTIATFQIYPLRSGSITLKVSSAEANRISFRMEGDQRVIDTQTALPVGANELILNISGETVTPPLEITATPQPSATQESFAIAIDVQNTASAPTLIPLSSSLPEAVAVPLTSGAVAHNNLPVLALAVILIIMAGFGLGGLWYISRHR